MHSKVSVLFPRTFHHLIEGLFVRLYVSLCGAHRYICLKGEGYIYLNGKKQKFTPNTWVWLPPWTEHGIDNTGELSLSLSLSLSASRH